MASKRLKECLKAGCRELSYEAYCVKHRQYIDNTYNRDRSDKMYVDFYNTNEWKQLSRNYKREKKYLCENCMKYYKNVNGDYEIVYGDIVHHMVPLKEAWSSRLDKNNLKLLCNSCHAAEHARLRNKHT